MITAAEFNSKLASAYLEYYHSLEQHSNAENISVVSEMLNTISTLALISRNSGRDHNKLSEEESRLLFETFQVAQELSSELEKFIGYEEGNQP